MQEVGFLVSRMMNLESLGLKESLLPRTSTLVPLERAGFSESLQKLIEQW